MYKIIKILAAMMLLSVLMGASCNETMEFTCKEIILGEGGKMKVTTWNCEDAETSIVGGKLYVKNTSKCKKEVREYEGPLELREYKDKEGREITVPLSEIADIVQAGMGMGG